MGKGLVEAGESGLWQGEWFVAATPPAQKCWWQHPRTAGIP